MSTAAELYYSVAHFQRLNPEINSSYKFMLNSTVKYINQCQLSKKIPLISQTNGVKIHNFLSNPAATQKHALNE